MFERDYIKRLIQQFAQVIEKIILYKKQQDWQQIQMVIDVSAKQLLGLNPDLIESMDSKSLSSMFQISDDMDHEKCFILGSLLQEQAIVYQNTNTDENMVYKTFLKSFDLFVVALENEELRNVQNIHAVHECCNSLQQFRLEKSSLVKMFNFYNSLSNFAEAENIILLLLKDDTKASKKLAREFYTDLLQLNNSDLNKGNLPREEIIEGLHKLDILNGNNH